MFVTIKCPSWISKDKLIQDESQNIKIEHSIVTFRVSNHSDYFSERLLSFHAVTKRVKKKKPRFYLLSLQLLLQHRWGCILFTRDARFIKRRETYCNYKSFLISGEIFNELGQVKRLSKSKKFSFSHFRRPLFF